MNKLKFKFKKLMNEYKAESNELRYVIEVLPEANKFFENYYIEYCDKNNINLSRLKEKHADRVAEIFSSESSVIELMKKEMRKEQFDSKSIFRQIAKNFHPDTIPLGDPRQEEYNRIFQDATSAINEAMWGELFEIVEDHDLVIDDYENAIECLKIHIGKIKEQIKMKKDTYAWILYESESEEQKHNIVKKFLEHFYADYTDLS